VEAFDEFVLDRVLVDEFARPQDDVKSMLESPNV
jgi:hypothetical protein